MITLEWGWRVPCHHPECDTVLDQWSTTGTPGLPYPSEVPEGWLWTAIAQRDAEGKLIHLGYCRQYHYIVYCPEHSGPALDYKAALGAWKDERYEIGQNQAKGFDAFLEKWGRRLFNHKVGQTVQEWEGDHPKPSPPWRLP